MKKIIISLFILFVVLVSIFGVFYTYLRPLKTINKNGVTFSYPKELILDSVSPEGSNYIFYQIKNQFVEPLNQSTIDVSIPLINNTGGTVPLSEQIKDFVDPPKITQIMLNGHEGEEMSRRIDSDSLHEKIILKQLKSQYPDSIILLTYIRNDNDVSLDQAWEIVQKTMN